MIFALDTDILSGVFLYVHSIFQTNTDRPTPPLPPMKDSFLGSFTVPCPMPGPDPFNRVYCTVMDGIAHRNRPVSRLPDPMLHAVCLILTAAFHREWEIKTLHQETDVSKQVNLDVYFLS